MLAISAWGGKCCSARAGVVSVWVGSFLSGTVQAQTKIPASPLDQLETILREHQSLQTHQTHQLQALRQQLDDQAKLNDFEDLQWLGSLALLLFAALTLAWLSRRWPAWQQAWHTKKQQRVERLESKLADQPKLANAWTDESEHLGSGSQIDHGGAGIVAKVLSRRKSKQILQEPELPLNWKAWLDESDSQLLADEAILEYELRKTVGIDDPATATDSPEASAQAQAQLLETESAWQAMQEVPFNTVTADVSSEVQRIRNNLRQRREKRLLTTVTVAESNESNEASSEIDTNAHVELPQAAPYIEQITNDSLASSTEAAQIKEIGLHQNPGMSFSVSSLPSNTEAETRLALGYEFQKMGQLDEAALLYAEVLQTGSAVDQFHARKLLSALPGH